MMYVGSFTSLPAAKLVIDQLIIYKKCISRYLYLKRFMISDNSCYI